MSETMREPDWTDSETGPSECWKSPFHSMQDRLLMADGAIAFRDKVIENLRQQLAALRTHENGGQESEAGAGAEVAYKDAPAQIWLNLGDCTAEEIAANNAGWNGLTEVTWCESKMDQFDIPYVRADLAPPSAQAIETAAIMRAAEVCGAKQRKLADLVDTAIEYGDEKYITVYEQQAATVMQLWEALLALIPQDGRTALTELIERAVKAGIHAGAIEAQDECTGRSDIRRPDTDAIVTNLIGVPPLSSGGVSGEKR